MKENYVYGEPEVMRFGNVVVTVHSPILTPEEREKRMTLIKDAAVRLVMSQERMRIQKHEQPNVNTSPISPMRT